MVAIVFSASFGPPSGRRRAGWHQNLSNRYVNQNEERAQRRRFKICVNNASHGEAVKGGRCQMCWDKKVAAQAARKAK